MFNIDPAKLLLVGIVALLLLGPDKLPAAARRASSFLADLHRLRDSLHQQVQGTVQALPLAEELERVRQLVAQGRSGDARSLLEHLTQTGVDAPVGNGADSGEPADKPADAHQPAKTNEPATMGEPARR